MATTQKRATGKRRSGTRSTPSRAAAPKHKTTTGTSQQRPIRRETTGIVFLILALCILISFFTSDGWLMVVFPKVLKGLFGVGFYLTVPALAGAGYILLTHRGRPVSFRVSSCLALPYLFGSIYHMFFNKVDLIPGHMLSTLWASGYTLESGGVLSGGTAHGFMAILGKPASVAVFCLLIAILLMAIFQFPPSRIRAWWQEMAQREYAEEDYAEDALPPPPRKSKKSKMPKNIEREEIEKEEREERTSEKIAPPKKPKKTKSGRMPLAIDPSAIDIPLDEGPLPPPAAPLEESLPPTDPFESDLWPEAEIASIGKREPDPPPSAPSARVWGKKKAANKHIAGGKEPLDVEEATAQVTAEIEKCRTTEDTYKYPSPSLLRKNTQENYIEVGAELRANAQRLGETLQSFGVDAVPGDVVRGPAITRYEFTLEQGIKLAKVTNLADDIALALGASGVRIAPIPDKISVVGIEVPNKTVSPVLIRDVIESKSFMAHKSPVAFALGRDIGNRDIVGDIARLPHVLIAGTTGSGKSVCTNSLIISILYKSSPEDVRFIMVDPKMVELAPYNDIPHLLIPVVTDPKKAAGALQWAVYEMMNRYKTFSELGVKKLEEYNAVAQQREDLPHMPSIIVVIDELADLMLVAAKEVEESICRVAQMGRAAGMHLVIATQRPSADVITGLMKANIPSRIAFAVASGLESRIILDSGGAEKLVGRGDMLYAPLGNGKPIRVQGCFITPGEIERVVNYVKSTGETQYSDEVMKKIAESVQEKDRKNGVGDSSDSPEATDELLPAAVEIILETGQASVSLLQRRLKLGYSRAARLVDQMEQRGYVGPFEGSRPRQVLITKEQWQETCSGAAPAASDGA